MTVSSNITTRRRTHFEAHYLNFLFLLVLCLGLSACASTPLSPQRPELPVETIDVVAGFGGEEVATGKSTAGVSVPADGNAQVDIEITTHLKDLFGKFLKSLGTGNLDLTYRLDGNVQIENIPKSFKFATSGNLLDATRDGN